DKRLLSVRNMVPLAKGSGKRQMNTAKRHKTVAVEIGGVTVGGGAPIVVQSMTNTDTADVEATARQVAALAGAGSQLVRITVERDGGAPGGARLKGGPAQAGGGAPPGGGFHYIWGKRLGGPPGWAGRTRKRHP